MPRGQALPQAVTESAREARAQFYCTLCSKGYARVTDFDRHNLSYEHTHNQARHDSRQMLKDPSRAQRAREAEQEASGMKKIDAPLPGANASGAPKKKPVFKSTLQAKNANIVQAKTLDVEMGGTGKGAAHDLNGAIANGWADDQYDPENVTAFDADFDILELLTPEQRRQEEIEEASRARDPRLRR